MDDPGRAKLKEDIRNVLQNSDDILRKFRTQIENKDVIIFVGNTRNGKSTLVNYITGTPLVAFQENSRFKIERSNGARGGPPIGHGTLSHTDVPVVLELQDRPDTIIIDAPGFDDNRGAVQEIINALYINQIKYSKGVRFVLVSDINNLINDNINYFLSFIETVHIIMPDFEKLKEAVSLVFTKDWRQYHHAEIIRLLKTKILDVQGLRCRKDLIRHFVEHEDLIGLFKMPTSAGPLTDEINVNVQGAIFKSHPVNLIESDIRFGISTGARVVLLETYLEFFDVVLALKETFKNFREYASNQFSCLSKDRLLLLSDRQLCGDASVEPVVKQFHGYIKSVGDHLHSVVQIPDSLRGLFVEEVDRVTSVIESIGVKVSKGSAPPSNAAEDVHKKLEYIACIEKVVEKSDKSRNILESYQHTTQTLQAELRAIHSNINSESQTRELLFSKLCSIPDIQHALPEVDEPYLFASTSNELSKMKMHLDLYTGVTEKVLHEISKRPAVERRWMQDIHRTSPVQCSVKTKIEDINRHLESREKEVLLKGVSAPVEGIVGILLLYAGFSYIRSFSRAAQLKIAAGSLLLFAVFSWKSVYMRTFFSRVHRRYQQKRLFTRRTKFDNCWKGLLCKEFDRRYNHYL